MRTTFNEQLDLVAANLQAEGDLVLRGLRGCLIALERQDAELADEAGLVGRFHYLSPSHKILVRSPKPASRLCE